MGRNLSLLVLVIAAMLSFTGTVYAQAATEEPVNEGFPAWAWVLIILAFLAFLCILFWWWLHARQEEVPGAAVQAPVTPAEPSVPAPKAPAVEVKEPQVEARAPALDLELPKVIPDDLKLIEGIGPKIATVLQAAGIQTFAQLAASNADLIKQILGAADPRLLRLADPASWPEQARHAAAGDFEALRKLQEALRAGRRA